MYGFHIRTKKQDIINITKNIQELVINDCKLIQIFGDEFDKLINVINDNNLNIILHSSFNINISQPFVPYSYTVRLVMEEIKLCLLNNISTYVLHCGVIMKKNNMTKDMAKNNMFKLLYFVSRRLKLYNIHKFNVCIELLAGSENDILYDITEFSKFYDKIKNNKYMKNIKLCLDTCHIFASGYDIRTITNTKKFIKYVDNLIGIGNIKLIHLNDSIYDFNSRKDQHADIGDGKIGSSSLKYIFKYFNDRKINIIFECPGDIKYNLNRVINE